MITLKQDNFSFACDLNREYEFSYLYGGFIEELNIDYI